MRFANPVLPGSHPDPSVCRVGDDYYLATSTFEYFPGITLHHSHDLVHWRPIGAALDRPSQLPLDGVRCSGGLYAPTLRHHDDTFYVVCTLVDGTAQSGNFLVTADDPSGSWSKPVWLPNAPGFDPSLLFDADGRCWMCGTHEDGGEGRTVVWVQELDLAAARLLGERHSIWTGFAAAARWAEGPHLYRIGDLFYLIAAEGGTSFEHAVVAARSDSVTGPYEPCARNPLLTHRHLGDAVPVVGVGHADLIDLPDGSWWAVLLGTRPYSDGTWNLGRETFLVPVGWQDGWPLFNPGKGRVFLDERAPGLTPHPWPAPPTRDDFDGPELGPGWLMIRTPHEPWWSLTDRASHLRLQARPEPLSGRGNPSFVGRRQQHRDFDAGASIEAAPGAAAGLAVLTSDAFQLRLEVTDATVRLVERRAGDERAIASRPVEPGPVHLGVAARGQEYAFAVNDDWLATADGRLLSWHEAGGFFGAVLGVFAVGVQPGYADVDWFDYLPRDGEQPSG
jgi:xylan 1,4-beta-xylosidase